MNLTITVAGTNYRFPMPREGYTSRVKLSLHHTRLMPRGYAIWDDGVLNDFRTCSCSFIFDATEAARMLALFKDTAKGRGVNVTLSLPANSGFFPFGPDKGDEGSFTVRLLDMKPSGVQEEPYQRFVIECEFVATAFPSWSPPAQIAEGLFQIGTIQTLRWPKTWSEPSPSYGYSTQITVDGSPYTVDKSEGTMFYETSFEFEGNESNSAALLAHLTATVRDAALNIIPPANTYIFGVENASTATYSCQWLDEELVITHDRFNHFTFPLRFYRVSG